MTQHDYPRGSDWPNYHGLQVFAMAATSTTVGDTIPFDTPFYAWRGNSCRDNRLHHIDTTEVGVLRHDDDTSLTREQLNRALNGNPSGTEVAYNTGQFKWQVTVTLKDGGNYQFLMDGNQSVELYASCVTLEVLGPAPDPATGDARAVVVPPQQVIPGTDQITVDALLTPRVYMVDDSLRNEEVKYTQLVPVAANETPTIQVPPRAYAFDIFTAQTVASWAGWIGDPDVSPGARQTQVITFAGGSFLGGLIGQETHLETDSVPSARLFEIRWRIRL